MKTKIFIAAIIAACLCFSACSGERQPAIKDGESNFLSSSEIQDERNDSVSSEDSQAEGGVNISNSGEEHPAGTSQNSEQEQSQTAAASETEIYRYDNIPGFPIPNPDIVPAKIKYYDPMLGETSVFVDLNQINQIIDLLKKVEIENIPTKKGDDAELRQVFSFYQNADDEEPIYTLYFFVDSLCIEINGVTSDAYPTINWVDEGPEDESKINVQFIKLICSWEEPGFPWDDD